MKLSIGVPCFDHVPIEFATSLSTLAFVLGNGGIDYSLIVIRSTALPDARNAIVEQAIANGSTHLLFLDSDMEFPANTVHRLLAHGKPIVGACGVKRELPRKLCGMPLSAWPETGLCEMEAMGMAVCLLSTQALRKIEPPHFEWITKAGSPSISEDVLFCRKAREVGLKIWCDVDLSKEIGHVGSYVYR